MPANTLLTTLVLVASLVSATLAAAPATVKLAVAHGAVTPGAPLILHFDEVKLPPDSSGVVRVFADLPEADERTSTEDPHYLGYFTVMAKTSREAAHGIQRKAASVDITGKAHLLAGKREITLTLVPLSTTETSTTSPRVTPDAARAGPTVGRAFLADH